jgi:hypothetical protein
MAVKQEQIKNDPYYIVLHERLHGIQSYADSVSDQYWHAECFSGHSWWQSLILRSDKLYKLGADHHGELSNNEIAELKVYLEEGLIDRMPY